jgi:site-specific recombinase XerD
MRSRRTKKARLLPEYVTSFRDRHGKERLRFRRAGFPSRYFRAALGTEEFREEYRSFNDPGANALATAETGASRVAKGTVGDLKLQYYSVPSRLGPTATTQLKIISVLNRGFFDGREDRPVKSIRFDHIEAIISKRRIKFKNAETGRWEGGVEAARKLRKELVRLFAFAQKKKMVDRSPMDDVEQVNVARGERSEGFHSWTEDEIACYRARHPIGTRARLAMELILWTDQRGIDSMHLSREHIHAGKFVVRQTKTGKKLILPIAPQLLEAIVSMPNDPESPCLLVTQFGHPFSRKGFGNKFRQWCDEAKLYHCSAHGLRKATLRRMANLRMSNKSMKSVSGHSKNDEIDRYTQAADQERLAQGAIEQLSEWEAAPVEEHEDRLAAAAIKALEAWKEKGANV